MISFCFPPTAAESHLDYSSDLLKMSTLIFLYPSFLGSIEVLPGPNSSSSIWYLKPYGDWVSLVENKLLLILVKLSWFSRTGPSLMVMSWPLSSWWKKLIDWSCSESQRSNAQSIRHEPRWDSWADFGPRFKSLAKRKTRQLW